MNLHDAVDIVYAGIIQPRNPAEEKYGINYDLDKLLQTAIEPAESTYICIVCGERVDHGIPAVYEGRYVAVCARHKEEAQ